MRGLRLDLPVKRVVEAAMDRHLLVVPSADSVIRILPPLDISEAALDQGVERLEAAILGVAEEVA
jgi:acetylornithine/N-succinyldiaminopimelate aminotransferase